MSLYIFMQLERILRSCQAQCLLQYFLSPAPVAQLDRALPSEGKDHAFESHRVHHRIY